MLHTCHRAWASTLSASDQTRLQRRHARIHRRRLPTKVRCLVVAFQLTCPSKRTPGTFFLSHLALSAQQQSSQRSNQRRYSKDEGEDELKDNLCQTPRAIYPARPIAFLADLHSESAHCRAERCCQTCRRKHEINQELPDSTAVSLSSATMLTQTQTVSVQPRVGNSPRLNFAECLACLR